MAILQSGYTDATRTNASNRSTRQYRDIALSFEKNNATKDVIVKRDIEAVKQSVKNLILTNHYERPFHPEIGSSVRAMLFQPMNPITANVLQRTVAECIENFEPRVRLVSVIASAQPDVNAYEVTISFYVVNVPGELITLQTMLERSR
jgi:hypothetical protein